MNLSKFTVGFAFFLVISAAFMRQVWEFSTGIVGANYLRIFCVFLFILAAIYILFYTRKLHFGLFRIILNMAVSIGAFIFAWHQPFWVEKMHVLEYGLLGWLTFKDLVKDKNSLKSISLAVLFVFLVGALDEIFQNILPYRVGEARDVLTNCMGGVFGIALYKISSWRK